MPEGNLYSYLLGPAPGMDQQKAIADQLRRRRSFGELGALTGDRVLQSFGEGMVRNADEVAGQLQNVRQKDIDNTQTKSYQDSQIDHMKAMEALTKRGQTLDHIYQMLMAQAAMQRANKVGEPKIPRLRQGDIKELQDIAQEIGAFSNLEDFIKQGHGFGAIEVAGAPIPGLRTLANAGAAMGIGSEKTKAAFAAKQEFDRLYTLVARNRLFGATLTANEQKAWADANPSHRQSDEQIVKALPVLRKVFERRLKNKARGLMRENYDPNAIMEYADIEGLGLDLNSPDSESGGHGPIQRRIKVDGAGNPIGN